MGEEEAPRPVMMSSSSSSLHAAAAATTTATTSSSIRFLGILKQPDSDPNFLELDECDVVWASSSDLSSDFHAAVDSPASPVDSDLSPDNSSTNHYRHLRPFTPEKFGLSAVLWEEPGPLVQQRNPQLGRSLSATIAARPVPVPKSGSGLGTEKPSSGSRRLFHQSAPVNVPAWPRKDTMRGPALDEVEDGEEGEDDDEEMLPPHVIVARSHVTTFSVFEGVGRTLKGRDLRRVRNAVFRKTGFLD